MSEIGLCSLEESIIALRWTDLGMIVSLTFTGIRLEEPILLFLK